MKLRRTQGEHSNQGNRNLQRMEFWWMGEESWEGDGFTFMKNIRYVVVSAIKPKLILSAIIDYNWERCKAMLTLCILYFSHLQGFYRVSVKWHARLICDARCQWRAIVCSFMKIYRTQKVHKMQYLLSEDTIIYPPLHQTITAISYIVLKSDFSWLKDSFLSLI